MRDLIVAAIVFGCIPFAMTRPWVGIYCFSWLSYMNPHRMSWGWAYSTPFGQITALVTMVAVLFTKQRNSFPNFSPVWILILFVIWQGISTVYALNDVAAPEQFWRTVKIQIMIVLTLFVITTPEQLKRLAIVIALSIGFFGIKGGLFAIMTGGSYRVWGPTGSFIEGNNEIGLALLMVLPLFVYVARAESRVWLRRIIWACCGLILLAVVSTYSRGAFVGLIAMVGFLWLKSNNKFVSIVVAILFGLSVAAFLPDKWFERMGTTTEYKEDASAMGRIWAWEVAISAASDRVTGGGYGMWKTSTYERYAWSEEAKVEARRFAHDVHSIYFEVMGEHGFIGFALFMAFIFTGWRQGSWVLKKAKGREELNDIANFVRMIHVGIVSYLCAGAFLGLASFDLFYHLISMLILSRMMVTKHLAGDIQEGWELEGEEAPNTRKTNTSKLKSWLPGNRAGSWT